MTPQDSAGDKRISSPSISAPRDLDSTNFGVMAAAGRKRALYIPAPQNPGSTEAKIAPWLSFTELSHLINSNYLNDPEKSNWYWQRTGSSRRRFLRQVSNVSEIRSAEDLKGSESPAAPRPPLQLLPGAEDVLHFDRLSYEAAQSRDQLQSSPAQFKEDSASAHTISQLSISNPVPTDTISSYAQSSEGNTPQNPPVGQLDGLAEANATQFSETRSAILPPSAAVSDAFVIFDATYDPLPNVTGAVESLRAHEMAAVDLPPPLRIFRPIVDTLGAGFGPPWNLAAQNDIEIAEVQSSAVLSPKQVRSSDTSFTGADWIFISLQLCVMTGLVVWALAVLRDTFYKRRQRRPSTLLNGGSVRLWFLCLLAAGLSVRLVTEVIVAIAGISYQLVMTPFTVALAHCSAGLLCLTSYSMVAGFFGEVCARAARTPALADPSGPEHSLRRDKPFWTPLLVGSNALLYAAFAAASSVTKIKHAHKEFRMCAFFLLGLCHIFLAVIWVMVGIHLVLWIRRRQWYSHQLSAVPTSLDAMAAVGPLQKNPSRPMLLSAARIPGDIPAPSTGSSGTNSAPPSRGPSSGGGICVLVTVPPAGALEATHRGESPPLIVNLATSPGMPRAPSARSLVGPATGGPLIPSPHAASQPLSNTNASSIASGAGPLAVSLVSGEVVLTLVARLTVLSIMCPPAFAVNGVLELYFAKQLWDILPLKPGGGVNVDPSAADAAAPAAYFTDWCWINGLLFISQVWPMFCVLGVFGGSWAFPNWAVTPNLKHLFGNAISMVRGPFSSGTRSVRGEGGTTETSTPHGVRMTHQATEGTRIVRSSSQLGRESSLDDLEDVASARIKRELHEPFLEVPNGAETGSCGAEGDRIRFAAVEVWR